MSSKRRQARILAMQALCQWDVQADESEDALAELLGGLANEAAAGAAVPHARSLVLSYWGKASRVDRMIESAATGWSLARMSPVDRNAMRVAVTELLDGTTPANVALNEAIEIGREFGGRDAPRFINGVLDAVFKMHEVGERGQEIKGGSDE